jgi:hypothetical protein
LSNFAEATKEAPLEELDHWIEVPEGRVNRGYCGAIDTAAAETANSEQPI